MIGSVIVTLLGVVGGFVFGYALGWVKAQHQYEAALLPFRDRMWPDEALHWPQRARFQNAMSEGKWSPQVAAAAHILTPEDEIAFHERHLADRIVWQPVGLRPDDRDDRRGD